MSGPIKYLFFSLFGTAIRELCFLLKTPSKLDLGFQGYRQFCPAENNKIEKELHTTIGCIQKSIFSTYDSFRLLTSHLHDTSHIKPSKYSSNSLTQSLLEWQFNFLFTGFHVIQLKHHVQYVLRTEKLLVIRNFLLRGFLLTSCHCMTQFLAKISVCLKKNIGG